MYGVRDTFVLRESNTHRCVWMNCVTQRDGSGAEITHCSESGSKIQMNGKWEEQNSPETLISRTRNVPRAAR